METVSKNASKDGGKAGKCVRMRGICPWRAEDVAAGNQLIGMSLSLGWEGDAGS
jgi:hypothetical protein